MTLQYLLPFHMSCINDECASVAVEAAEGGIELLDSLDHKLELSPTDFKVFVRYIFPEYQKLCARKDCYATSAFIKCLGRLAVHAKRLIERGMISHIRYVCDVAAKEAERRDSKYTETADAVTSPYSIVSAYENEAQDVFSSMFSFCKQAAEKPDAVQHWNIPNHLHEYRHA